MAGFEIVGLSLACVLLAVSMIGPVIAPQVQPFFGLTIDTTLLVLYFFIFATVYNAILLTTIALQDRKRWLEAEAQKHVFSIMIPCRNEENVIKKTILSLVGTDYPAEMAEILVINDGSIDKTGLIVNELSQFYPNINVLEVPLEESGRGKSTALNKGFKYLMQTSKFRNRSNWIIGVLDADGRIDRRMLSKASHRFQDEKIGAVQVLVRINNPKASILTMLQDIEFVTFAKITQSARAVFKGAVALGGNGQFVRAETLKSIRLSEVEYWRNDALTEDLDLGTRVLLKGWENSFLSTTVIYQHGVTTLSALYKQRTRWSWGAIQCFLKYVPTFDVAKTKHKISLTKRLDLTYYLSATLLPPIILLVWALSIGALIGLFRVTTPFPTYFLIANSISFFPVIGYGLWTVRREYKAKYMIPLLFLTNAYTYHWVLCTFTAMTRVIRRKKPRWAVTKKHAMGDSEVGPTI
jgi:1,2-diacylglycerol 3-beta-glucosyltransferase